MLEYIQWQGRRNVSMQREILSLRARLTASLLLGIRLLRALRREEEAAQGLAQSQFKGRGVGGLSTVPPHGGNQAGWGASGVEFDLATGAPSPAANRHKRARPSWGPEGEPHPWATAAALVVCPEAAESCVDQPAWGARARTLQFEAPHRAPGATTGTPRVAHQGNLLGVPPEAVPLGMPLGAPEPTESCAESPWSLDECSKVLDDSDSVEDIMALDSLEQAEAWEAGSGLGCAPTMRAGTLGAGGGPGTAMGKGPSLGCDVGARESEIPGARECVVEVEGGMGECNWRVQGWEDALGEEGLVLCCVCREEVSRAVVLPCSHMVACKGCALKLTECSTCSRVVHGQVIVTTET